MSVNDALFVTDGIHPNTRGAQKLISNLHLADLATVQRPPGRSQQFYNYGGTTDSYRYRNQIPISTTMRCTWCRERKVIIHLLTVPEEATDAATNVGLLITRSATALG